MMYTNLVVWGILLVISVSDAKVHRIPNKLLMLLLVSLCVSTLAHTPQEIQWSLIFNKLTALGIAFVFALFLHLIRVMAPGDVKLIAVLGFFLGTSELANYLYYVCLISIFVGSMYWLLNRLYVVRESGMNEKTSGISLRGMTVNLQLGHEALKTKVTTGKELTYMPFAPILVLGLALHQYYT